MTLALAKSAKAVLEDDGGWLADYEDQELR